MLELIAVLMVIAVTLALAVPSLRNFAQGRELSNTTRSLTATAGWARSQAISEGRPHRLHVDVDQGEIYVTADQGGVFERIATSLGRTLPIPERIDVQWEDSADAQRLGYVMFHPSGRVTPATLVLRDAMGHVTRIQAETPGDRFAVVSRSREGASP